MYSMEFSILYAIPRSAVWDSFFLGVTKVAGSYGQLWVVIALLLLIFKKTRRAGIALLIAAMSAKGTSVIGNIDQIDRGYENIDQRLNALGAAISRL